MSSNYATPGFGRLNWNISREVTFTLSGINDWINIFGAFYELTVVIFFIVKFFQKKSGFREPYYIIYTIGCFIDAFSKVMVFLITYINTNIVFLYIYSFLNWYYSNFITLWNLLLAVNRFTAILFTLQFSNIWSNRNTTIIIILLLSYPVLVHCHNPVFMWCQITGFFCPRLTQQTSRPTDFEIYFSYISDISYAILATVLCTIAALKIVIKKQLKNQNVEKVLLIQSFTSSVFLVLSTATTWLAFVNGILPGETNKTESSRASYLQAFLSALSYFFLNLHHYIGLLMLLIVSRNFRTKYLEFFKITVLMKWFSKTKPKADATNTVVVVAPASTNATPKIAHVAITFLH